MKKRKIIYPNLVLAIEGGIFSLLLYFITAFVVDETKSSFLSSSVSTALNKANEKMINSMGW